MATRDAPSASARSFFPTSITPEPAPGDERPRERPADQPDAVQPKRVAERFLRQGRFARRQGANDGSHGRTYSQCQGS